MPSSIYDSRFAIYHPPPENMKRQLTITSKPISEAELLSKRNMSVGMGAVVCFLGVVRGTEESKIINAMDYEAFQPMEKLWPIESVRLIHRIGIVKVNDPSLWVEVIAPHRGEAFAASQWLIDQMKSLVPIWKKPVL